MDKPDIATLIDSRFEEMTDLEQEIARYFLQAETLQDDLSSQQVTQKLHISQAALTRFAKKCGFTGYREFIFQYQHQYGYGQHKRHQISEKSAYRYAERRFVHQRIPDSRALPV